MMYTITKGTHVFRNISTSLDMKICLTCNQEKSLESFTLRKNRHGNPYRVAHCKSCRAEGARQRRAENPEAMRAYGMARRVHQTAEQKQNQRAYMADWRKKNKEKILFYRSKDRLQKYSRTWYEKHKEEIKQKVSSYRKKNVHKVRALNQYRRGLQRSGKLSQNIIEFLFAKQRGLCVCCRQKLGQDFHLDHIIPLSLGGKNVDGNVQLLRSKCNLQKNAKHPVDFMQERGFLL